MPVHACPTCGVTITRGLGPPPAACPDCCASLEDSVRSVAVRRPPTPVMRIPLGSDSHAPGAARKALRGLRDYLGEDRFRVCELLVSELVTNVVRHAGPPRSSAWADMRVRRYPDRVRVEIRDDGPGLGPKSASPDHTGGAGWGLQLVDEMADDWGAERGLQNCVWFELATT